VAADLAETVDSVESDGLDLVVEHVDEEVLRQFGKRRRMSRQLTQRVDGSVPHLCVTHTPSSLLLV